MPIVCIFLQYKIFPVHKDPEWWKENVKSKVNLWMSAEKWISRAMRPHVKIRNVFNANYVHFLTV